MGWGWEGKEISYGVPEWACYIIKGFRIFVNPILVSSLQYSVLNLEHREQVNFCAYSYCD